MADTPELRPLVLFHASCADGFCAAWVAHRRFGGGADYVAVNNGEPPPDVAGRHVYVLDFSYPRQVLLEMARKAAGVSVLDHHASAREELAGLEPGRVANVSCVFDLAKSGGRLAWEYFFPRDEAPWLVRYTEDRDLWLWKLNDSRAVSAFIASWPFSFTLWDQWHGLRDDRDFWMDVLAGGRAIIRYQDKVVEEQCKHAHEVTMAGHKVLAVNATHLISEIAGKLAENRPFGVTFFVNARGETVFSLRSRQGGIDVSEIAKSMGGGGHPQAAGFTRAS